MKEDIKIVSFNELLQKNQEKENRIDNVEIIKVNPSKKSIIKRQYKDYLDRDIIVYFFPVIIYPYIGYNIFIINSFVEKHDIYKSYDSPYEGFQKLNIIPVYNQFLDLLDVKIIRESIKRDKRKFIYLEGLNQPCIEIKLSYRPFINPFYVRNIENIKKRLKINYPEQTVPIKVYLDDIEIPFFEIDLENKVLYLYPIEISNLSKKFVASENNLYPNNNIIIDFSVEDFLNKKLEVIYYSSVDIKRSFVFGDRVYYKIVPYGEENIDEYPVYSPIFYENKLRWIWKSVVWQQSINLKRYGEQSIIYLKKFGNEEIYSYWGGYNVFIVYENMTLNKVYEKGVYRYQSEISGWLFGMPLLRQGDLVRRFNGDLYIVNSVEYTFLSGMIFHQSISLISASLDLEKYLKDNVNTYFILDDLLFDKQKL